MMMTVAAEGQGSGGGKSGRICTSSGCDGGITCHCDSDDTTEEDEEKQRQQALHAVGL